MTVQSITVPCDDTDQVHPEHLHVTPEGLRCCRGITMVELEQRALAADPEVQRITHRLGIVDSLEARLLRQLDARAAVVVRQVRQQQHPAGRQEAQP